MKIVNKIFFFFLFKIAIFAALPAYSDSGILCGAHYYAGWWRNPRPFHFLTNGVDWRPQYPDREPVTGWYDDQQGLIDQEIVLATEGGISFFSFDFYTAKPSNPPLAGNNNGLNFFLTSRYKCLMNFVVDYINSDQWFISDVNTWNQYVNQWISYFQDPQYLKINGKPVFIIYNASDFADQWGGVQGANQILAALRNTVTQAGFPGMIIGGGATFLGKNQRFLKTATLLNIDFITAYNFDFTGLPQEPLQANVLLTYLPQLWSTVIQNSTKPYTPIIAQGHDSRPAQSTNFYLYDNSPEIFKQQLVLAKSFLDNNPGMQIEGKQIIMMNAWNELANGGIIIPTISNGALYLEQINNVLE